MVVADAGELALVHAWEVAPGDIGAGAVRGGGGEEVREEGLVLRVAARGVQCGGVVLGEGVRVDNGRGGTVSYVRVEGQQAGHEAGRKVGGHGDGIR
jgi:hypothetical protein